MFSVRSLCLAIASASFAQACLAGYPVVQAKANYCRADIRVGNESTPADQMSVLRDGSVAAGNEFRGQERQRICVRRSNFPSDCNSGLGGWNCISGNATGEGKPQKMEF